MNKFKVLNNIKINNNYKNRIHKKIQKNLYLKKIKLIKVLMKNKK